MNLRHQDAEGLSRRGTLNAREMAMHLYFSPDQFKRLEWAVEMPGWPRLQEPKSHPAHKVKLPHDKLGSAQTILPPQTSEAQEHGVKGMQWGRRQAKLDPPAGASNEPSEKSRFGEKNKMSNEEAMHAMKSLPHDFSGHEDQVCDILNRVRRDEWPGIVDYYEH
ncbi:MAG: hypothetical protein ACLQVG_23230 [Terriglobia bacterium]